MLPSEMPECASCGANYPSALAAAICCDPEPQPR
jgi:hypothetical protein